MSEPQYVAILKDDGPDREQLPVIVQVPDLNSIITSYRSLLNALRKSNLTLEKVDSKSSQEIFTERLSEFLVVGSDGGPPTNQNISEEQTTGLTTVNSNRAGDTVLYAKGYFVSTGTAFGISTPAKRLLPRGRYSFGIMEAGGPRFEEILWTCPTAVKLNLPR
jgi:hypothetical protein